MERVRESNTNSAWTRALSRVLPRTRCWNHRPDAFGRRVCRGAEDADPLVPAVALGLAPVVAPELDWHRLPEPGPDPEQREAEHRAADWRGCSNRANNLET